jgi:hypothetical protein
VRCSISIFSGGFIYLLRHSHPQYARALHSPNSREFAGFGE